MFKAIYSRDQQSLERLATDAINSQDPSQDALILLSLDHLFEDITKFTLVTHENAVHCMGLFFQYTLRMYHLLAPPTDNLERSRPSPSGSRLIQKLFAVHPSKSRINHITLPHGTYLHQCYQVKEVVGITTEQDTEDDVHYWAFDNVFRKHIGHHLFQRVRQQVEVFFGLDERNRYRRTAFAFKIFEPCLTATVSNRRCIRLDCTHVHSLDIPWYNRRLCIVLHQILILDMAQSVCNWYTFKERQLERQ